MLRSSDPFTKNGEKQSRQCLTLHQGKTVTEKETRDLCRGKIAGYKIPKSIDFVKDEEMPMTPDREDSSQDLEGALWQVERSNLKP